MDTSTLASQLTPAWQSAAAAAKTSIAQAGAADRSKEVDRHAALWRAVKPALLALSSGKCWYCESRELRSTNAVDHYRPKSELYEDELHPGYWWLALEPSNFRFACEFCNSYGSTRTRSVAGGKRTHFPLQDESRRAYTDQDSLTNEYPLLLDPVAWADPSFLWFDPDGQVVPEPGLAPGGVPYRRASCSIEIYNLNEAAIADARLTLSTEIAELVDEADDYWRKVEEGDHTAQVAFDRTVKRLFTLVQPGSEFSAAARCALMRLRGTSVVPDTVLKAI